MGELVAQPQRTPGPRQVDLTETGQAEFVICDYTIEFNFRDAKQYWGLEDLMNVKQRSVYNGANLSLFMVNLSRAMMVDFRKAHPNFSANDLKAHYRGVKYVEEVLKLLPAQAEPILIEAVFSNVLALGSVNVLPKAA